MEFRNSVHEKIANIKNLKLSNEDESGTQIIWENLPRYSEKIESKSPEVSKILTDDINKVKDAVSLYSTAISKLREKIEKI